MARGVYKIENAFTNQAYVGSAYDCERRWRQHQKALRLGVHHSSKLQQAWHRFGSTSFQFRIIEHVDSELSLEAREQHWIDRLDTYKNGYNSSPIAARPYTLTEDDRALIAFEKRHGLYTPKYIHKIRAKPLIYNAAQQTDWEEKWNALRKRHEQQRFKGWLVFGAIILVTVFINPVSLVFTLFVAAIAGLSVGGQLDDEVRAHKMAEPRARSEAERENEIRAERAKRRRPRFARFGTLRRL